MLTVPAKFIVVKPARRQHVFVIFIFQVPAPMVMAMGKQWVLSDSSIDVPPQANACSQLLITHLTLNTH